MDGNGFFSDAELAPHERQGARGLLAISSELQAVVASAKAKDAAWKLLRVAGLGFLAIVPALGLLIETIRLFTGR